MGCRCARHWRRDSPSSPLIYLLFEKFAMIGYNCSTRPKGRDGWKPFRHCLSGLYTKAKRKVAAIRPAKGGQTYFSKLEAFIAAI